MAENIENVTSTEDVKETWWFAVLETLVVWTDIAAVPVTGTKLGFQTFYWIFITLF